MREQEIIAHLRRHMNDVDSRGELAENIEHVLSAFSIARENVTKEKLAKCAIHYDYRVNNCCDDAVFDQEIADILR